MAKYRKSPHCQHQNTHPNLLVYPRNNPEHQPLLAVLEIWVIQTIVIIFSILPYNPNQWPSLGHRNTSLISLEFPCENNKRLERRSTEVWAADVSWQASLYQFTAEIHTKSMQTPLQSGNRRITGSFSQTVFISYGDSMYVTSTKF